MYLFAHLKMFCCKQKGHFYHPFIIIIDCYQLLVWFLVPFQILCLYRRLLAFTSDQDILCLLLCSCFKKIINRVIYSVGVFQELRERGLQSMSEHLLWSQLSPPPASFSFKVFFANHYFFMIKNPHRIAIV